MAFRNLARTLCAVVCLLLPGCALAQELTAPVYEEKGNYEGDLTGWSHEGYMPRVAYVYGRDPERMPFDFPEVVASLAPRAVFANAPLNDDNFEVSGVREVVAAAREVYERLYDAGERLVVRYPESGHDFPPAVREEAYAFLDQWLK